jgi:hypothetical protein
VAQAADLAKRIPGAEGVTDQVAGLLSGSLGGAASAGSASADSASVDPEDRA